MAKQIKAFRFSDIIENLKEKKIAMDQELAANGGMCLNCGEFKAEPPTYNCVKCNNETEEILKKLRGPGFGEFRI